MNTTTAAEAPDTLGVVSAHQAVLIGAALKDQRRQVVFHYGEDVATVHIAGFGHGPSSYARDDSDSLCVSGEPSSGTSVLHPQAHTTCDSAEAGIEGGKRIAVGLGRVQHDRVGHFQPVVGADLREFGRSSCGQIDCGHAKADDHLLSSDELSNAGGSGVKLGQGQHGGRVSEGRPIREYASRRLMMFVCRISMCNKHIGVKDDRHSGQS